MKLGLAIVIIISLSSCISYPSMHYSVSQNVPLLTQKNEARFSAATGNEAIGLQAAYAFSKSWAVMGSYSGGLDEYQRPGLMSDGGFENGKRHSGELAIGYFESINTNGVFEIYGGVERYYRSFSETSFPTGIIYTSIFSTNCTKPFVQLDLGFQKISNHSFSLSCKVGLLEFDHFSYLESDSTGKMISYSNNNDLSPSLVVEPCITYRLGKKNLNFQAQAGFSYTNSSVNGGALNSDPFFFNIGLTYRLIHKDNVAKEGLLINP